MNDCEEEPAGMGAQATVASVEGLNHSTASVLEGDIAERSTVNDPPEGE